MKNKGNSKKLIFKIQFLIYSSACCLLFILLYIAPMIIDYKLNGYASLSDKYFLQTYASTPSEAFSILSNNWLKFINPFSIIRNYSRNLCLL